MIFKKLFHQAIIVLFVLLILLTVMGCAEDTKDRDYGVFLSVTDDLDSLAEYTTDKSLIKEIKEYCAEKAFNYYISDSLELD